MPMSLREEIRLLSMVDILGPLSEEEMEDLAKRAPDTFLEQDDILHTPKEGTERLFILKEGRVQLYEINGEGEEITLSVIEDGNVFGEMALTGQGYGPEDAPYLFWRVANRASPGHRGPTVTVEVTDLERALLCYHARPLRIARGAGVGFIEEDDHDGTVV